MDNMEKLKETKEKNKDAYQKGYSDAEEKWKMKYRKINEKLKNREIPIAGVYPLNLVAEVMKRSKFSESDFSIGTIYKAMDSALGERDKDILYRYFGLGQTYAEIAEIYGMTASRVGQIIRYGRFSLRSALEKMRTVPIEEYQHLEEKYENLLIDFHGLELLLKEHEEHIYLGTELKNDIKNAEEKIRNMSIQDVELSMRSANGLYRSELFTVGAVADYINSGKNLLELKNIGKRSKNEIILTAEEDPNRRQSVGDEFRFLFCQQIVSVHTVR